MKRERIPTREVTPQSTINNNHHVLLDLTRPENTTKETHCALESLKSNVYFVRKQSRRVPNSYGRSEHPLGRRSEGCVITVFPPLDPIRTVTRPVLMVDIVGTCCPIMVPPWLKPTRGSDVAVWSRIWGTPSEGGVAGVNVVSPLTGRQNETKYKPPSQMTKA